MSHELEAKLREIRLLRESCSLESPQEQIIAVNKELGKLYAQTMMLPEVNVVCCFMVDIAGHEEGGITEEDAGKLEEPGHVFKIVERVGGGMAQQVLKLLQSMGANMTDGGGGLGLWHIGVYCAPGPAWVIWHALHERFGKAIQSGLLTVTIRPWAVGEGT